MSKSSSRPRKRPRPSRAAGVVRDALNRPADLDETRDLSARYPERVRELEAAWDRQADEFRALAKPSTATP